MVKMLQCTCRVVLVGLLVQVLSLQSAVTSAQVSGLTTRTARDAQPEVQEGLEDSPLSTVTSVVGGRAVLGCDVTTENTSDTPILILFYRHPRGTPIYSIDARSGPFHHATHWSDPDLGARAYFNVNAYPPGLVIHGITRDDEGDYRCRVDFRLMPTRNARIRLNVVVPTSSVTISVGNDTVSGVIGPFPVGRALDLTCTATGGHPPAAVTWWDEGFMVDSLSEFLTEQATHNTLTLHRMRHSDLYRKFTCQAVNSNLTMPKAETVTLDLIFPLEEVSILESSEAMAEGQNYSIVCETRGSRPPAVITWWMNDIELTNTQQEVLFEASISRSILAIEPERSEDGAFLSCRAYNPLRNDTVLQDNRTLTVHYPPDVSLQLRGDRNITTIQENDSITFDCLTEAKPDADNIQWFITNKHVEPSLSSGILIHNSTMQLHKVSRNHSGLYTCQATNTQGNTTSNGITLNVKYAPVCGLQQKSIYSGGEKEAFNITCNVEAHPAPTLFRWALNSSHGLNYIAATRFLNGHSHSTLSYKTHSPDDFGSLLCWAENEVGQQLEPCYFIVDASVAPESVHNCTIGHSPNILGVVMVDCRAGWGGGLEQTYSVEVTSGEQVLAKLGGHKETHFTISGLIPGDQYNLTMISHNAKGSSVPKTISLKMPLRSLTEKHISYEHEESNDILFASPILGILVGVAGALVICLAILVMLHVWNDMKQCKRHSNRRLYDKVDTDVKSFDEGSLISQEICGSDIILLKADQYSPKENDHIYQYIRAQENVYVEPRTLITKNIVGTLERDNKLAIVISKSPRSSIGGQQSPRISIGNPQLDIATGSYHSHRNSFNSGSSSPPVHTGSLDREAAGRHSPASSVSSNPRISSLFSSRRGSCSTILQQPDCYMPNAASDSITAPLVTPTKAEKIESSV